MSGIDKRLRHQYVAHNSVLTNVDFAPKREVEVEQAGKQMFPAMTQEEIEDWMEHIPVFAVTDMNGAGVVLKPDESSSVFYFFFNPLAANATLTQLQKVNEGMEFKVSAFSLGKIWFKLLNADPNQEVLVGTRVFRNRKQLTIPI